MKRKRLRSGERAPLFKLFKFVEALVGSLEADEEHFKEFFIASRIIENGRCVTNVRVSLSAIRMSRLNFLVERAIFVVILSREHLT